ncbi:MAG: hypothetical protein CL609_01260 [Anaerolineaceae bacterium]|nr:hypothetical protein [Anaerolineaceae bacterium]
MITTKRLTIRSFQYSDLERVHQVLSSAFNEDPNQTGALNNRESWLNWSILNQKWFHRLSQPPFGEQAICRNNDGLLIGVIGLVPCLDRFDQFPELSNMEKTSGLTQPEVGLFWAIDPDYQKQGYATEAAKGFLEMIWNELKIKRIIATTEYENYQSQNVMRKIGMKILKNNSSKPPWLQVVGVINHPKLD